MKGTGQAWLAQLIHRPLTLSDVSITTARTLPGRLRQFPLGSPKFPLPVADAAAQNVRSVIDGALLGLTKSRAESLWAGLFDKPTMLVELTPTAALAAPIPVALTSGQHLRHVAFGAVFRHPEEDEPDALVPPRIAAIAQLTVLVQAGRNIALDAWLTVIPYKTTRSLQLGLELLDGVRVDRAPGAKRLQIIVADRHVKVLGARLAELERSAWVAGIQPEFLLADSSRYENVHSSLVSNATEHAIFIGPFENSTLADAFTALRGHEAAQGILAEDLSATNRWTDFLNDFREVTAYLAGSDHDLTTTKKPVAPSIPLRPRMPIRQPERCLHLGSFVYVYDAETKLWWTRDLANHGGIQFKTYKQEARILRHQAERDGEGLPVEGKTKGADGLTVDMNDLHPCNTTDLRHHLD